MDTEKKFKIRSGYCHIYPERIMFSRNGVIKSGTRKKFWRNRWWLYLADLILIALLLVAGLYLATLGKITLTVILALAALYRIINMMINLVRLSITEIRRDAIIRVRLNPGIKGISRARVRFIFKTPKGKKRRKLIILMDAVDTGHADTEHACRILRDEGLIY